MKVIFNDWHPSLKKLQNDDSTRFLMDKTNKTRHYKKKTLLIDVAREAYEKEWVYFATAFQDEKPFAFLSMNKGFFNINFLDEHLRKYRMYVWNRGPSGQIFLHEAQSWEYIGDTDEMASTITRFYYPEGILKTGFTVFPSYDKISQEFPADVSTHWVDFPRFGEFDSLMQMDLVDWELGKV